MYVSNLAWIACHLALFVGFLDSPTTEMVPTYFVASVIEPREDETKSTHRSLAHRRWPWVVITFWKLLGVRQPCCLVMRDASVLQHETFCGVWGGCLRVLCSYKVRWYLNSTQSVKKMMTPMDRLFLLEFLLLFDMEGTLCWYMNIAKVPFWIAIWYMNNMQPVSLLELLLEMENMWRHLLCWHETHTTRFHLSWYMRCHSRWL